MLDYTKGEWKIKLSNASYEEVIVVQNRKEICEVYMKVYSHWGVTDTLLDFKNKKQAANAHLIAAAPAMYEALEAALPTLQGILDIDGGRPKHVKDRINMVVEALALARRE